jgi:hypothetical protein
MDDLPERKTPEARLPALAKAVCHVLTTKVY